MTCEPTPSNRPARRSPAAILIVLLTAAALAAAACSALRGQVDVSNTDEVRLGQRLDESLEQDLTLLPDDAPVTVWANELTANLADAAREQRAQGYRVQVVDADDQINAFALPGGHLYITSGLVLEAESCGEVAAAIAHQMGHLVERHGIEKLEDQFGAELLTQLKQGQTLSRDVIRSIQAFIIYSRFDDGMERGANDLAFDILDGAGYDPAVLVALLEHLRLLQGSRDRIPALLAAHPAPNARITRLRDKLANRGDAGGITTCIGTQSSLETIAESLRNRPERRAVRAAGVGDGF